MPVIYIDRQIVISHESDKQIIDAVAAFRSKGATFPYSPAHIEEIAKAHFVGGGPPLKQQIAALDELSEGQALMPRADGPAELRHENILACLERVMDHRGRELTEMAVDHERDRIQSYAGLKANVIAFSIRKRVQKCSFDNVFSDPAIIDHMGYMARVKGFRIRSSTFIEREATFSILFDALNIFGFRPGHSDKRVENRVHDVSHAIYASYADLFVTDDDKLRNSTKAVYKLCGFDLPILDRGEFIALSRSETLADRL